ncbi:MAG: pilus assembly FimT family protein [Polyangiaceae bacterium]
MRILKKGTRLAFPLPMLVRPENVVRLRRLAAGRVAGRAACRARHARGFSMIELLVVIILIGILAAIALPSMLEQTIDRHVYSDALALNDLVREARTHAIGRGGAVMLAMTTAGGTPGTFTAYEAVQPNPQGTGPNSVPLSSCKSPTNWTLTDPTSAAQSASQFQELKLGSYETTNGISTRIFSTATGALAVTPTAYLCFTPLGRTYVVDGGNITAGMFANAGPMTETLQIEVARRSGASIVGIVRSVLIPPNGVTRILSAATAVQ